jgi:hypothetical protein
VYEQSKRSTAVWVWVGAGVLVLALAVAGVVTVLVRDKPDQNTAAPLTPITASPPPTSAAPSQPARDACVVGNWTEKSNQSDVRIYGAAVHLVGSGATHEFRADGTGATRYANIVKRGQAGGRTYEVIHNGAIEFTWRTSNGSIIYSGVRANGATTWKVDGGTRESKPFGADFDEDRYTCSGDSLVQKGSDYTIELTRTR